MYDLSSGWGNATISPGQFMEGTNQLTFDIAALNHDPLGYVTIFADSYIEIINENDPLDTTLSDEPSITTTENDTIFSPQNDFSFVEIFIGAFLGSGLTIGGYYLYKRNRNKVFDVSWASNDKHSSKVSTSSEVISKFLLRETQSASECSICRNTIIKTDSLAICPFCQNHFHLPHFEETLKVTGKCPICQREIIHG